jgi:hypothetical protein
MLFIQSLTYTLTNPDDGSCEDFTTEHACLQPDSPYATGASKCAWNGVSEAYKCTLVQPDGDFTVILFVAIFSAVISTPLALFVDWMLLNILSAPTKVASFDADTAFTTSSGNRAASAAEAASAGTAGAVGASFTSVVVGEGSSGKSSRGNRGRFGSLFGVVRNKILTSENNAKMQAQTDLRSLVEKLTVYRDSITADEKIEFDGNFILVLISIMVSSRS